MLVQIVGNKQLAYVKNHLVDYMSVADEFGMVENNALADYVTKTQEPYLNNCGINMPSIHLVSKTLDLHVVDEAVTAKSTSVDDIVKALNYFPQESKLMLSGYPFISKFSWHGKAVSDVAHRTMSFREYGKKDLKGIFGLMTHLGDNNASLYEPVIARYVYTSYQMPRHRQLVGYFELGEYLHLIRDNRSGFFTKPNGTKALVYVECGSTPPTIKVTGITKNCAQLDILGLNGTYDAKRLNEFKPYIIVTRRPLQIKTMKFPWTKVHYDHVDVFLTPIMSLTDAWETLGGGINLLTPPTGETKNLTV